ncbi:MAG: Aspartokinase [Thermotoga sp. 50_1627]|nr:MAG: Aspartokinase [Thermotoga sp. 50_64]KUK25238.1 MAG: Aspartokinase [Thermotoga sp. 50_1627]MBC7116270.1 aspartate kinase [Pseudothermotoga sp.]MDK2923292.1 bifunctional aspartokinase / homoserine dehydrogenase 1 [Pseudothermotoga sp.]HBT38706.1 aspartate kinase [Pseudothermotoga sp.]
MSVFVVKFGGSSLKNKEDLLKILEVVRMYNKSLIIVISAAYNVTNQLIDAVAKIDRLNVNEFLTSLYERYRSFLGRDDEQLKERVFEIKNALLGAKLLGEVPVQVWDRIVSHGERCSSLMITKFLKDHGFNCEEALPERFGLVTNGRFGNATVELEASRKNAISFFERGKNYVVPGFYGLHEGRVTILGRGGSDYTATCLAYCLDAERVDLYKDVSGFMTCDPKHVDSVKPVRSLSYDEAAELSYFGAKILHHASVEPLRKKGIPLYIFNINNFKSIDEPDTIITANGSMTKDVVKSISFTDDIAVIQFRGSNVGRVPGLLGQIASTFGTENVNIKSVITAQTSINVLISRQDLEKSQKIVSRIKIAEVEQIHFRTNISLIAVVGNGILQRHGIAARIFTAVSREKINVLMISAGASEVTVYFIVNLEDRDRALRAIHEEFFGGERA